MPKTDIAYPEQIMLRVPRAWGKRLARIAQRRGMSRSEFLRSILRDRLDAEARTSTPTENGRTPAA